MNSKTHMIWQPLHRPFYALRRKRNFVDDDFDPTGFLLKEPVTKKIGCENIIANGLEIGHASMQGYRQTMEDEHVIEVLDSLPDHTLVAVMDGHAGTVAAEYAACQLSEKLQATAEWNKYMTYSTVDRSKHIDLVSKALVHAYLAIDEDLYHADFMDQSGCTAVSCVITPTHIVCANVGDSRAVVSSKNKIISLTEDHKPSNPEELSRIEAAGGFVLMDRVNGELAMSRALGDFRYKDPDLYNKDEYLVIAYPDVAVHKRDQLHDQVLLLACDGVFDVLSNEEACRYITEVVWSNNTSTSTAALETAESLIDLALKENSTDNITALVVKLS